MAKTPNAENVINFPSQEKCDAVETLTFKAFAALDRCLQIHGNPSVYFTETTRIVSQADQCVNPEESLASEMPDKLTQKRCLKQIDALKTINVENLSSDPDYRELYEATLSTMLFYSPGLDKQSAYLRNMDAEISENKIDHDDFIRSYLKLSKATTIHNDEGKLLDKSNQIGGSPILLLHWWGESHGLEVAKKYFHDLDKFVFFPLLRAVYCHAKANILLKDIN